MNTDAPEKQLAQAAMTTAEQRMTMLELMAQQKHGTNAERRASMAEQARRVDEQQAVGNRLERRKAAKLTRQKAR